MNAHKGFTLLEALIVTGIAALLITVAIPSFNAIIKRNRIASEVNRFIGDIQLARSEAVKRGQAVSLCGSGDGTTCGGGGVDNKVYEKGWLLYADVDGRDDNYHSDKDTLIRANSPASPNIIIRSDAVGASWLSFSPNGMLNENNRVAHYVICDKEGSTATAPGRLIKIDATGLPKTSQLDAGASCTL